MRLLEIRVTHADNPNANKQITMPAKEAAQLYPAFADILTNPNFYALDVIIGLTHYEFEEYQTHHMRSGYDRQIKYSDEEPAADLDAVEQWMNERPGQEEEPF